MNEEKEKFGQPKEPKIEQKPVKSSKKDDEETEEVKEKPNINWKRKKKMDNSLKFYWLTLS